MKKSRIQKQIEEIQILDVPKYPDIIYKYRIWNDDFHKILLSERNTYSGAYPPTLE